MGDPTISPCGLPLDVLQRLPRAAGGLNTKVNNSGNIGNPQDGGGVGAGTSEIDLRYLLAKRTLVLVDGLRYVPAAASGIPSTVDLNSIPEGQIERIKVLQSGQSPLYGSDAIAGVVNTFYGDVQLVWTPGFFDRKFAFTLGVINVFDRDPPACYTCTGPNYDPTTYDVPGQFGYLRVSYRM